MAGKLSPTMTLREFENGYWYLDALRDFALEIGILEAKRLRSMQLAASSIQRVRFAFSIKTSASST